MQNGEITNLRAILTEVVVSRATMAAQHHAFGQRLEALGAENARLRRSAALAASSRTDALARAGDAVRRLAVCEAQLAVAQRDVKGAGREIARAHMQVRALEARCRFLERTGPGEGGTESACVRSFSRRLELY